GVHQHRAAVGEEGREGLPPRFWRLEPDAAQGAHGSQPPHRGGREGSGGQGREVHRRRHLQGHRGGQAGHGGGEGSGQGGQGSRQDRQGPGQAGAGQGRSGQGRQGSGEGGG